MSPPPRRLHNGVGAAALADGLRDRIEELAPFVLDDLRCEGGELRGRGPDGAVWCIGLRGRKRGVWLDTADPRIKGDPLELVRWGRCGGDRSAACRWAAEWLGLAGDQASPMQPPPPRDPAASAARIAREEADAKAKAARLWARARAVVGSPAEAYLAGRGLPPGLIGSPPALRFLPHALHSPEAGHMPAMLAAIVLPATGELIGIHATFLAETAAGWAKTAIRPGKKVRGLAKGGVIALGRGRSGRPLPDAPQGDRAVIAEGVENALSAIPWFPEHRVLAAVSVGNLPALRLPAGLAQIVLVADRDGENDAVHAAREAAMSRWHGEGRRAETCTPPEDFKDLNEYLTATDF